MCFFELLILKVKLHAQALPPTISNCQVRVLVHTPSNLTDRDDKAGLVYAHGGAVLSGTADLYKPHLSRLALNLGMPVFNVDYRQQNSNKMQKLFSSQTGPRVQVPSASPGLLLSVDPLGLQRQLVRSQLTAHCCCW